MKESKNEVTLQRMTKEQYEQKKQEEKVNKTKKKEDGNGMKARRGVASLSKEMKNKIIMLNGLQILFLILAVVVEVLAIYLIVPQIVSIISLVVLSISCIYTMKKINRIMESN